VNRPVEATPSLQSTVCINYSGLRPRREYRRVFDDPRPARTTIQSDLVGFDVEGDAVVWLGE
jgi:hypothetical protein